MAYTLQAFIGKHLRQVASSIELPVVELKQGYEMIPLVRKSIETFDLGYLPMTADDLTFPEGLKTLGSKLSEAGPVAYCEAEIFGGSGLQATVVFVDGKMVGEPAVGDFMINDGLKAIGVKIENGGDEFLAVGLDRHRITEEWLLGHDDDD